MDERLANQRMDSRDVGIDALRVGLLSWKPWDEMAIGFREELEYLGHETVNFPFNARLPENLDVILTYGPNGSLTPLAKQLCACPPGSRPKFALILTEQLPNPDWPEWFRYRFGQIRSGLERMFYRRQPDGSWTPKPDLRWLLRRGIRFRYYGDLYWFAEEGILSALAVWSNVTAHFLRARGFNPIVLTHDYKPEIGKDLDLKRDIPVLWLGKIGSNRRGRLLKRLRTELASHGVDMFVVDGVEHPYVYGEERTILLNRTKIVLNLLRKKWDDNSFRLALAAHNKALVVSEPMLQHSHFVPGEHIVESSIEQMADTIKHYLSNEGERQRIAERAYNLVQCKSGIGRGITQILEVALGQ